MARRIKEFRPLVILRHAVRLGNTYNGVVTNHPEFEDGSNVITSKIIAERYVGNDTYVETENTTYLLR